MGSDLDHDLEPACYEEIVRWNGCELHNIAALMGGIAAQEAIKIILEQFIPVRCWFIFVVG